MLVVQQRANKVKLTQLHSLGTTVAMADTDERRVHEQDVLSLQENVGADCEDDKQPHNRIDVPSSSLLSWIRGPEAL